jgi:hypothetical protein
MNEKGPIIYMGNPDSDDPPFKVITLNGSSTQVFPSGLIRYDRTYLVNKENTQVARQLFQVGSLLRVGIESEAGAGSPFIFPDPKEVNDVPGFIKFLVTAYSDSRNVEFRETFNQQQVNLTKGFTQTIEEPGKEPVNYSWSVLEKYFVDSITTSGVAPIQTESVASTRRLLKFSLIRKIVSGTVAPGGQVSLNASWSKESVSVVRRNFGRWTEYEHTETLIPYY